MGIAKSWGLPLSFLFGCQGQVNGHQTEAGELMCLCQAEGCSPTLGSQMLLFH